jgi:hypothetical protein
MRPAIAAWRRDRFRVVAVSIEIASLIPQSTAEQAAVDHKAGVSARRQLCGAERAVDEVEIRPRDERLAAERHLEAAGGDLEAAHHAQVDERVLPVGVIALAAAEFPRYLEVHAARDGSGDLDARVLP